MPTKSPLLALIFCLLLFNLGLAPSAPGAPIDLVVEHGVQKKAEAQARLALNTAVEFFQRTYRLSLQRNVQVLLVPDKIAYARALSHTYGLSGAEAEKLAEKTTGFSRGVKGAAIIVNMGKLPNRLVQLFCLCHELVHQYQSQESRGKHAAIRWVSEGAADALAAHILETAGFRGAVSFKKFWLESLSRALSWPRLEKLHTYQEWFAAMDAYGADITYSSAALAALNLVQWRGYRSLFDYFSALGQGVDPNEAFNRAFGAPVRDFERQFRPN